MKSIKFLMTIMLVAMCVSFVSCGDKDQPVDNELEARGLIGEWSYKSKSPGLEYRYVFKPDGTAVLTYYTDGAPTSREDYTYTYDESTLTGRLTLVNNSFTSIFKYEAGVINLYSTSGEVLETYTWYASLPKDRGILGDWSLKTDNKERRITFKNDGTLDVRDYRDGILIVNGLDATFKYSFDEKTSSGQIIRMDDNTVMGTFKYIDQRILIYVNEELEEIYTRRVL